MARYDTKKLFEAMNQRLSPEDLRLLHFYFLEELKATSGSRGPQYNPLQTTTDCILDLLDFCEKRRVITSLEKVLELYFPYVTQDVDVSISLDGERFQKTMASYLRHIRIRNEYIQLRGVYHIKKRMQVVEIRMDDAYFHLSVAPHDDYSEADRYIEEESKRIMSWADLSRSKREKLVDALSSLRKPEQAPVKVEDAASENKRVVILGDPGAGKTTILRYLAYQYAIKLENKKEESGRYGDGFLPIYVSIPEYAEARAKDRSLPLAKYLATYCESHGAVIPDLDQLLVIALEKGQAVILLDALDEVSDQTTRMQVSQRIDEFVREHSASGNRFVITSRIAGYRTTPLGSNYIHYRLLEMSRDDIEVFLRKWCYAVEPSTLEPDTSVLNYNYVAEQEIRGILSHIDRNPSVASLATNPLLLTIIALIHRTGASLPDLRIQLYDTAAMTLIHRWEQNPYPSPLIRDTDAVKILGSLAYCMYANHPIGSISEAEVLRMMTDTVADMLAKDPQDPAVMEVVDDFLTRIRESTGLFVELSPQRYGFLHLTFEDYFAARFLVRFHKTRLGLIRHHLHDPQWQEIILLALGFLNLQFSDEAADLLEELCLDPDRQELPYENLFYRDLLFLLTACADGVVPNMRTQQQVVQKVLSIYFDMDQDKGIGRYKSLREQIESAITRLAGLDMGKLFAETLMPKLEDSNPYIILATASLLNKLSGDYAQYIVNAIRPLLGSRNGDIKVQSIKVISSACHYDSAQLKAILHPLLEDSDGTIRRVVIEELSSVFTEHERELFDTILLMLKDPYWAVRITAVKELNKAGATYKEEASKAILPLLGDKQWVVRSSAGETLSSLCVGYEEEVFQMLLPLLKDKASDQQRMTAVEGLSRLGNYEKDKIIGLLLPSLKDKSVQVRRTCVEGLNRLGVKADVLVPMLSDVDWRVRRASVVATSRLQDLENYNVEASVVDKIKAALSKATVESSLLGLLNDPDWRVQLAAIGGLIIVGGELSQSLATLKALLNKEDKMIRSGSVELLGRMGAEMGVDVEALLLRALHDPSANVRRAAVEGLSKIGANSTRVERDLYEIAHSAEHEKTTSEQLYNVAYQALYTISSAKLRTRGKEDVCKPLSPPKMPVE